MDKIIRAYRRLKRAYIKFKLEWTRAWLDIEDDDC